MRMTTGRLRRDKNDEMVQVGILSCYSYQHVFSVSLSQSPMSGSGSLAPKCLLWLPSRKDNSHLLYWNRGIGPSSSRSRITITSMSTCQQCNFLHLLNDIFPQSCSLSYSSTCNDSRCDDRFGIVYGWLKLQLG